MGRLKIFKKDELFSNYSFVKRENITATRFTNNIAKLQLTQDSVKFYADLILIKQLFTEKHDSTNVKSSGSDWP